MSFYMCVPIHVSCVNVMQATAWFDCLAGQVDITSAA